MGTKYIRVVVIVLFMTTTYATCRKSCIDTVYSFAINAQAYPDKDSIHTGDTLWLEVNCPTTLLDNISGKMVDYSGAQNLGTTLSFVKFIGGSVNDPGAVYSANNFSYYLEKGSNVNNSFTEGIREYFFLENNGNYQFKIAVIPQQIGTYSLGIGDASNVFQKSNKCSKAGFTITFNNINQHLYFLENNRPNYEPSGYESTHLYCFKVY